MTTKKTTKKVREGIINRYFMSYSELPHSIEYLYTKDGWWIYRCESANFTAEIAHKELFNQFIKW
jgi:hypothetical protein